MIRHHFADSCTSLNTIPPGKESQRCKGRWQTHAGSLRKAISHNLHAQVWLLLLWPHLYTQRSLKFRMFLSSLAFKTSYLQLMISLSSTYMKPHAMQWKYLKCKTGLLLQFLWRFALEFWWESNWICRFPPSPLPGWPFSKHSSHQFLGTGDYSVFWGLLQSLSSRS